MKLGFNFVCSVSLGDVCRCRKLNQTDISPPRIHQNVFYRSLVCFRVLPFAKTDSSSLVLSGLYALY